MGWYCNAMLWTLLLIVQLTSDKPTSYQTNQWLMVMVHISFGVICLRHEIRSRLNHV